MRPKMTSAERLHRSAINAMKHQNMTPYTSARLFEVDRSNMAAYWRYSRPMPLKLACRILDYMDAKIVVFKAY